jgi:uncharacterized membrane protein (DUF106 family)
MIKKAIDKMAIWLGLFLMFGIILIPDLRNIIGKLVGEILNPLLSILPLHIIIFILAAITGLYASLIQKYTMDWELMRRVQDRSKVMQKELRQAQLTNNAAKIKKLQAQQAEMMEDQMGMMKQQFKPMLYISIISIPLFFWVYTAIIPVHFTWDDVQLNDSSELITFIERTQGVGLSTKLNVEKSFDNRTIIISDGSKSFSISLDAENKRMFLKTDTGMTKEYEVKVENNKRNIYAPEVSVIFPFWGEQKLTDKVFWQIQYWLFWYFICSMPVSQITRKAFNIGGM